MSSLVDECARILQCVPNELHFNLFFRVDRSKVLHFLMCQDVVYSYRNFTKIFKFGGLTLAPAQNAQVPLSRIRWPKEYTCTVTQYFLRVHRAWLQYPYLPCVIEKNPGELDRYFPMEFVELKESIEYPASDYFESLLVDSGFVRPCKQCGENHLDKDYYSSDEDGE